MSSELECPSGLAGCRGYLNPVENTSQLGGRVDPWIGRVGGQAAEQIELGGQT